MGATYRELDVVSRPLVSGKDFLERLAPIRGDAEAQGRQVIVAYVPSLKKELEAKSIMFDDIILGPLAK